MDPITFRIIVHGLIALAPQQSTNGPIMNALLVSTKNRPVEAECFATHDPKITFSTESRECTDAAPKCKLEKERCVCDLDRDEVSLSLSRVPVERKPLNKELPRTLPFDNTTAGDFAYVVNLAGYGYTLARGVLPDPQEEVTPPTALAARFQFPFDTAAACNLATRKDDNADYAYALGLRPLGDEEKPDDKRQVMAQRAETTVRIDPEVAVKLIINSFSDGTGGRHEFTLKTDLPEEEIEISNDRQHYMESDHACDDGIGRDFASFYELVTQQFPTWGARPVPHVKYSMSKSIADLFPLSDPDLCRGEKAPMSHPICPMASFN